MTKDDCISRQAAIDKLKREERILYTSAGAKYLIRAFEDLPSAQPEFTEQDMRDEFNAGYALGMEAAQSERKKGKWVEVAVTDGYDKDGIKTWISVMQCDQCGFIVNAVEGHMAQYNYCPNCGADMRSKS